MVSAGSIAVLALCAVVGVAAPFALAWAVVKKYNVRLRTVLIGAGVFVLFALVLETIMHQIVLKGPHGAAIMGNVWLYALYGGMAAALFEETGRFLAMKFLLRREPTGPETALGYGAGHGGVEMLLIYGLAMVSNIAIAILINTGNSGLILATVPAEAQAAVQEQFAQLEASTAGTWLTGLWERASAIVLQLSLSVLVWIAVTRGGKWMWLLGAAIALHFLVDACTVVLVKAAPMWAVETIICAMALAAAAAAWLLVRKLNRV